MRGSRMCVGLGFAVLFFWVRLSYWLRCNITIHTAMKGRRIHDMTRVCGILVCGRRRSFDARMVGEPIPVVDALLSDATGRTPPAGDWVRDLRVTMPCQRYNAHDAPRNHCAAKKATR